MYFFFILIHKLCDSDFECESNTSTIIELISEHTSHHEETTLIFRYRLKSGNKGQLSEYIHS